MSAEYPLATLLGGLIAAGIIWLFGRWMTKDDDR